MSEANSQPVPVPTHGMWPRKTDANGDVESFGVYHIESDEWTHDTPLSNDDALREMWLANGADPAEVAAAVIQPVKKG